MKQIAINLACVMLMQTASAINLSHNQAVGVRFMDDVVKMLAQPDESEPVAAAQCNPCPASAVRPNPHYGAGL